MKRGNYRRNKTKGRREQREDVKRKGVRGKEISKRQKKEKRKTNRRM